MSGRPEILFPLFASLETLPGIGSKTAKSLAQMQIEAPRDLLFTLPTSVIDRRIKPTIQGEAFPATLTTKVTVERHYPAGKKGRPYRVTVSDESLSFALVFFHRVVTGLRDNCPKAKNVSFRAGGIV